jgi:hypothetical protein
MQITIIIVESNIMDDVHMQQQPSSSNKLQPLVFQGGLELKENICVDDQWWIECCPPNYAIQCFALQKTMVLKCKARINLCKFISGTPASCYSSFWVQYHSRSLKHHKHWFCPNDLSCCINGTS